MSWCEAIQLEHSVAIIQTGQEIRGVNFDDELAKKRIEELETLIDEHSKHILEHIDIEVVRPYKTSVNRPFLKTGGYNEQVRKWYGEEASIVGGPFSRVEFRVPSLSQRDRIIHQFLRRGWKPKWKTEKGSPQITRRGLYFLII